MCYFLCFFLYDLASRQLIMTIWQETLVEVFYEQSLADQFLPAKIVWLFVEWNEIVIKLSVAEL